MAVADNTLPTPYLLKPIEYGVDLVAHSTTKYLNGHCDVVGGAVVTATDELAERVHFLLNAMGTCASPTIATGEKGWSSFGQQKRAFPCSFFGFPFAFLSTLAQ